jgi:hypothetical protein
MPNNQRWTAKQPHKIIQDMKTANITDIEKYSNFNKLSKFVTDKNWLKRVIDNYLSQA